MNKTLKLEDQEYTLISNEHEWRAGAGVAVRLTEVFHPDGKTARIWGVMSGNEYFRDATLEEAEQLEAALHGRYVPQFNDVITALHYLSTKCVKDANVQSIDLSNQTIEIRHREDFSSVHRFRVQADDRVIYVEFMSETACVKPKHMNEFKN